LALREMNYLSAVWSDLCIQLQLALNWI